MCTFQAKQHEQADGATDDGHEFLIWEDRGAGPVENFADESENELPGPAEVLLSDRQTDEAGTSSLVASGSSSEDDRGTSEDEGEDDDQGATANEAPQPGTTAPEQQPPGRSVLLWEDRQRGSLAREVQNSAHTHSWYPIGILPMCCPV